MKIASLAAAVAALAGGCASQLLPTTCGQQLTSGGCVAGACTLSALSGTLAGALGEGATVELAEEPLPSELAADALGVHLCKVTLPPGVDLQGKLSLALRLDPPVPDDGVLFQVDESGATHLVTTSLAGANAVTGLIAAGGTYGVTRRSPSWSLAATVGTVVNSSGDAASLLRNLSHYDFGAAFFDGANLYVGNGNRLLVYRGLPTDPRTKPAVVLGEPDLDTTGVGCSSSRMDQGIRGLWSDGARLVAASGNRVLVWESIPASDFAPADLVLGQPDFSSDDANNGGIAASSLYVPTQVDSDGTRLAVADAFNNRVLVWDRFPTTMAEPASSLIGEPTFRTNDASKGAINLYQAWGVALVGAGAFVCGMYVTGIEHVADASQINAAADFSPAPRVFAVQPNVLLSPAGVVRLPAGGLAVRDTDYRIAIFHTLPTQATNMDFVLGQPDASRLVLGSTTASTIGDGVALGKGGETLLIPDGRRLLVWDHEPAYGNEPASHVLGQAGFSTDEADLDYRDIAEDTLAFPADVALQGSLIAVADRGNNRVLLRADAGTIVLGQPDAHSYLPNADQSTPGAATMSGPAGVALDGSHLIVADTENHRVLIWNQVPTATGSAASLVLGQADFSGTRPNRGRLDTSPVDGFSDAAADGFFEPMGVASDAVRLYVADRLNHRVLVWSSFPTQNGQPADAVLGQAAFSDNRPNHGSGEQVAADGFNLPTGLALSGSDLWVADTENNRVVRWSGLPGAPAPTAVLGQPDLVTRSNPNYFLTGTPGLMLAQPTTAASVLRPRDVALAGGRVFVSEMLSHRVHMFDATTLAPAGELGQQDDTTATANSGGVGAAALNTPLGLASDAAHLWVADSGNHRVLAFDTTAPPASGAAAGQVMGQESLLQNGFNRGSSARGGVTSQPRGLALSGGELFVADADHHRVLVFATPAAAGDQPTRIYGQPNDRLALANSGGAPSPATLQDPRGVFADDSRVIIADTGNHRVLVFDRAAASTEAALVLGQADFLDGDANRGSSPSAATLNGPEAVWADAAHLAVADTGNHRVLVWSPFPTASGAAATAVIGQDDASQFRPNRGSSTPSARSLLFPTGVLGVSGGLLVADAGNNRVLLFAGMAGPDAALVLGQGDLESRVAPTAMTDASHLGGPVALAEDGSVLYVLERDLGRVAMFSLAALAGAASPPQLLGAQGGPGFPIASPDGLAVEKTPLFTSRLYLSDTGGNRVIVLGDVSRLLE